MAVRTSSQSGKTHSSPFAFGSTVNDGDILLVGNTAHAIEIDDDCTLGESRCTTHQTRPAFTVQSGGGSLTAGTYSARLVAVGLTGQSTYSAISTNIVLTAGQYAQVTIPALPAGATSFELFLTLTSNGATGQRRYATGLTPGTFNTTAALWEDNTVAYASASTLPMGDAVSMASGVTAHAGGWTIAPGVKVTLKGDFSHLGNLTRSNGAGFEFDATDSPSGAAIYRHWFGTVLTAGTPTLIDTWDGTDAGRCYTRSKTGTTAGHVGNATQSSTTSDVRFNIAGTVFGSDGGLGDATFPAVSLKNAAAYNNSMTDVIFHANCRAVVHSSVPATGGWIETRVSYEQTAGNTFASQEVCVAYQQASISADVTSGTRTCTDCVYKNLPPAISRGGSSFISCVFGNVFAPLSTGTGGSSTSKFSFTNCFIRKPFGGSAPATQGDLTDYYVFVDYLTNSGNATYWPSGDFNPHGLGMANNTTATMTWTGGLYEYNGNADDGDMNKSPVGSNCTTELLYLLGIPNGAGKTPGSLLTNSTSTITYKFKVKHATWCTGQRYAIATQEGSSGTGATADQIQNVEDSLFFSASTATAVRTVCGDSRILASKVADICSPAGVRNNGYFNLMTTSDPPNGLWAPHDQKFTVQPDSGSIVFSPQSGTVADLATNGFQFVAPTRNFAAWADTLGASGTPTQRTQYGLDRLFAIANVTSANYVPGLTASSPYTYIKAGFAPTNILTKNAGFDGTDMGAVPGVYAGSILPIIQQHRMKQGMM